MLALRQTQFQPQLSSCLRRRPRYGQGPLHQRLFMQGLCDAFLDLAIALPIPPALPPYSTTIIATTVVARAALLPVAIWGKNRTWRIEELVAPEIEKLKPIVSKEVLHQMKKERICGDKPFLQETHAKRCIELLSARRKELFKEHKCSPLPSIILPPLSQIPVFVVGTMMLGRLSLDPTPFDSESFLTLTTLAHPDPTMTLPIILGILTMANVESSNWMMNAAERERERRIEEQAAKRDVENGALRVKPRSLVRSGLRVLSIGRIILAAIAPGSVTIYWVTSAAFGLLQTWFMDWQDIRRRRLNEVLGKSSTPPAPTLVSQTLRPGAHKKEVESSA